jgi:hypothetical protein
MQQFCQYIKTFEDITEASTTYIYMYYYITLGLLLNPRYRAREGSYSVHVPLVYQDSEPYLNS